MNIAAAFRKFWYHDTVDEMQRKMLDRIYASCGYVYPDWHRFKRGTR